MKLILSMVIMAVTTYLIRMLPFTLFRRQITSPFIKSLFYYLPYAVISAMIFPSIFYATGNVTTALVGMAVGLILAFFRFPLIVVALACAGGAFLTGLFL